MNILFPALILLLVNLMPAMLFRRKFGKTLPVTMISISLLMMVLQFVFHTFNIAVYLTYAMALAGIALAIFYKDRRRNLKLILTSGFAAYLLIVGFVVWADYARIFSGWDELQHWGKMVKEMLRLDQFYSVDASTLPINKDYPPFISCFQLFWVKAGGGYSEALVSMGLHVMLYSFVIPVILDAKLRFEKPLAILLKALIYTFAVVILLFTADIDHQIFTIYVDCFIGILFFWCLFIIYIGEAMGTKFGLLSLTLGLTALLMSKQICLIFVAVCAAAYILTVLLFTEGWKKKCIQLGKLVAALVLPAALYLIWNGYIASIGVDASIASETAVTASDLLGLLGGNGSEEALVTVERMVEVLSDMPFLNTTIGVSALALCYLCTVLQIAHGFLFRKEKTVGKDILFAAGILFAGAVYVFGLIYVFVFCFNGEDVAFGSLARFYCTFTMFDLLFTFAIYLRSIQEFKDARVYLLPLIVPVLLLVLSPGLLQEELPDKSGVNPNQRFKDVADFIQEHVEPGQNVLLVFTSSYINDYRMKVNYYLEGIYTKGNSKNIMGIEYTDNTYEIDGMRSRFETSDYVYIQDATGTFNWNCREFVEGEQYQIGGLYEVRDMPDHMLKLIGVNPNNPDPRFWEDQ